MKVIVPWLTNKLSTVYQTQSFTSLQEPATCPIPEPDQSNPCLPSCFLKISFNDFHPSMPGSSEWFFCLGFPNKSYAYFISPCMLHTPLIICLIPHTMFCEQYTHYEPAHNIVFFIPLIGACGSVVVKALDH